MLSKKRIVMLFVYTMFLAAIMMVVSSSLYAQVETGPTGSEPTLNRTVKGETEESAEDAKRVIHNHYHYHITPSGVQSMPNLGVWNSPNVPVGVHGDPSGHLVNETKQLRVKTGSLDPAQ